MEQFETVKEMIENLRSDDPELRLNSMRGIHLIATTLGPERTRDELLLYLTDYLDENDEVLRVFANAMGTMLQEVGGIAYVSSLLSPLEVLASLDEVSVRDEAVTSLQQLGETMLRNSNGGSESGSPTTKDPAVVKAQADFTATLERMSKGTAQSRSSACHLIATVYNAAGGSGALASVAARSNLVSLFKTLCADDEIMVRRSACVAMSRSIAAALGPKSVSDLVPSLTAFSKDSSDGVRLQAVASGVALLRTLPETLHDSVLQSLKALATDNSWRVRYMSADNLGEMAAAMAPPDVLKYAVPIFRSLCQDAEPEVRASAVFNMASVLAVCRDASGKKEVLMNGTALTSDESSHVRMSLASAVLKSVAHVPRELWGSTIVPKCTSLLNDTESDVRLALVSGFSSMGNTAEARELAPRLIPVVISLSGDPKWRLREVVVSQVPYVITSLGRNAEVDVVNVCVERLSDRVASIRTAAVQSCCKLVAENTAAWAASSLFPRLADIVNDGNYLHRVSLCQLYAALANVAGFDRAACMSTVWPSLEQMSRDEVPNVRMNVAKALLALQKAGKLERAKPDDVLATLKKDAVEDVRDAANGILTKD